MNELPERRFSFDVNISNKWQMVFGSKYPCNFYEATKEYEELTGIYGAENVRMFEKNGTHYVLVHIEKGVPDA